MSSRPSFDISTLTVLKIFALILAFFFLYTVREVLLIVFVALVLAAAIDPSITLMERRGIPRGVGIALIYIGMVALLSLIVVLFVPLVTTQLTQFINAFPAIYAKGFSAFQDLQGGAAVESLQKGLGSINEAIAKATQGFFTGVVGFFGGLISVISILVLTFYMTMEEKGMKRLAIDLSPVKHRPYLSQLFNRIEERLGSWLRGQLFLGLIIAVLTYIGLTIFHVKFAIVLALFAGLTELLPIIGPLIGAIPAVLVALSTSGVLGLEVAGLYIVIQQLENHIIVPRVVSQATGLNPVIVILAVMTGGKIAGITGVILAVPTMIIITTFLEDFLEEKKNDDARLVAEAEALDNPAV